MNFSSVRLSSPEFGSSHVSDSMGIWEKHKVKILACAGVLLAISGIALAVLCWPATAGAVTLFAGWTLASKIGLIATISALSASSGIAALRLHRTQDEVVYCLPPSDSVSWADPNQSLEQIVTPLYIALANTLTEDEIQKCRRDGNFDLLKIPDEKRDPYAPSKDFWSQPVPWDDLVELYKDRKIEDDGINYLNGLMLATALKNIVRAREELSHLTKDQADLILAETALATLSHPDDWDVVLKNRIDLKGGVHNS